jgi:hypothetical protein
MTKTFPISANPSVWIIIGVLLTTDGVYVADKMSPTAEQER